ncbi:HAD-superfamily hydrolase, subfamily IA, variant 2 [Plesiocystis pacifica SIR-1]|uniref:HAD-superfamily hydrolase, subfamily IA, variant 2 n=1 Tax=Plesiocystis pacifica SIR-1 TaxID=391625 RepID=A6G3R1_9BACT|nr:haloacid dehalogenase type II [Plesiocystis pacifica]EDM79448.1 HAD-superfamily hydrolase, subfamily IA, variant 2 [Plesiocystis pacifica SIR-1]
MAGLTLSFDCYGTLIDWESGILVAMQPVLRRHEVVCSAGELLRAYARAESAVEAGDYRPYREVLRRSFAAMAKDLGFAPQADELETFVESLPRWQPFPDTRASLAALQAAGHRLVILSNVDDDLFAATAAQLGTRFDKVITAAQVQRYKPDPAVFRAARAWLESEHGAASTAGWVHVAQSRFHDIGVARSLGLRTVHVERASGRDGSAVPEPEPDAQASPAPDFSVPDLASLVTLVAGWAGAPS